MSRRDVERIAKSGVFSSLSGIGNRQECLIHVYWTGLHDAQDNGHGHSLRRGYVCADLGLDEVPDPPFTNEEMQEITRAAKMGALNCLRQRLVCPFCGGRRPCKLGRGKIALCHHPWHARTKNGRLLSFGKGK